MKLIPIMLVALGSVAPVAAHADVCSQLNGSYVDARSGVFNGANLVAFDRLKLSNGIGSGVQLTMSSDTSPTAGNILIHATSCTQLTPNSARITFDGAYPGKVFSSAGSAVFTIFDGGARVWIKGETKGAELPGWLLRIPAPM